MKQLTKEDIQFIDNYLLNSGVVFKDVRFEMTDHVANAVEKIIDEDDVYFYDAFKFYMIKHKADLLKQNEIHYKIYKSLFKSILLKSMSLKSIAVFALALVLNYVFFYELNLFLKFEDFKLYSFGVLYIPVIFTMLFNRFNAFNSMSSGNRYSAINGMLLLLLIGYYVLGVVFNIFFKFFEKQTLLIGFGFLTVFVFNFCLTFHQYINKYKTQFA